MATSSILPFGGGATNEQSDATYAASPVRTAGVTPGVADPLIANKVWHQTSLMAAGLAAAIAAAQSTNITDSLAPSQVADAFRAGFGGITTNANGSYFRLGATLVQFGLRNLNTGGVFSQVSDLPTPFASATPLLGLVTDSGFGCVPGGINLQSASQLILYKPDTATGSTVFWWMLIGLAP